MSIPFPEEVRDRAAEEFSYITDGVSAQGGPGGFTFGVASRRDLFRFMHVEGASVFQEKKEIVFIWARQIYYIR